MPGQAFVTVATQDEYAIGGVVLGESLRRTETSKELVILITEDISLYIRQLLSDVYDHVYLTTELCSHDDVTLSLLGRPELGVTFTKFHCWRLTQYQKCVFLDADTLVLQPCDELFERDELSAVPDTGWPDCFNSGVFVFRPSLDTYAKLVSLATSKGSFDGGDQGLLNAYFGDWREDLSKRLPFVYNVVATTSYTYAPAYKHHSSGVKIVHFLGSEKPWSVSWMTESGNVQVHHQHPFDMNVPVLQMWMGQFREKVLPKLPNIAQEEVKRRADTTVRVLLQVIRDDVIRQNQPPVDSLVQEYFPTHTHQHYAPSFEISREQHQHQQHQHQGQQQQPPPEVTHHWEAPARPYEEHHDEHHQPAQSEQENNAIVEESSESHWESASTNTAVVHQQYQESHHSQPAYQEPSEPHWEALLWHQVQNPWEPPSPPPTDLYPTFESQHQQQDHQDSAEHKEPSFGWFGSSGTGAPSEHQPSNRENTEHAPSSYSFNTQPMSDREPSLYQEIPDHGDAHDGGDDDDDDRFSEAASLAWSQPSETQEESFQRMKSWEEGRIDYMGRDNFDNILKRLESMFRDDDKDDDDVKTEVEEDVDNDALETASSGHAGRVGSSAGSQSQGTLGPGSGVDDDDDDDDETLADEASSTVTSEALLPYPEGDFSGMIDWQEGRIDYGGKDRSDNIMKRLDMIFSGKLVLN